LSEVGNMQGSPWFYKNHVFECIHLIFERNIIKVLKEKIQKVFGQHNSYTFASRPLYFSLFANRSFKMAKLCFLRA